MDNNTPIYDGMLVFMERNSEGIRCENKILKLNGDMYSEVHPEWLKASFLNEKDCYGSYPTTDHKFWISRKDVKYVL
jgi:hypothetical protein